MPAFKLFKQQDKQLISSDYLSDIFKPTKKNKEKWLFIVPHDDDIILGAGLLIQKAIIDNIDISVIITTDGSLGYCNIKDRDTITGIRREETRKAFGILGLTDALWLNFPDDSLTTYVGRRKAAKSDPCILEDYTGLQNAYTYHIRKTRPSRIFIATGADLHPDHKLVYQEVLISLFHASGDVWPELGSPANLPVVYEMAVYCDFPGDPDIKIEGDATSLNKKLEAIRAYQSQKMIETLIKNIEKSGPVEYFRNIHFGLYSPDRYKGLF